MFCSNAVDSLRTEAYRHLGVKSPLWSFQNAPTVLFLMHKLGFRMRHLALVGCQITVFGVFKMLPFLLICMSRLSLWFLAVLRLTSSVKLRHSFCSVLEVEDPVGEAVEMNLSALVARQEENR